MNSLVFRGNMWEHKVFLGGLEKVNNVDPTIM